MSDKVPVPSPVLVMVGAVHHLFQLVPLLLDVSLSRCALLRCQSHSILGQPSRHSRKARRYGFGAGSAVSIGLLIAAAGATVFFRA